VLAAQGHLDGRDGLLLLTLDAGSLTTVALMAATTRALAAAPPVTEMEPTTVDDDVLRSWQREPSSSVAPENNATGASDGRWLWIVALALLALESWLRRDRREHSVSQVARDRAA
jgi:hypothetical protein